MTIGLRWNRGGSSAGARSCQVLAIALAFAAIAAGCSRPDGGDDVGRGADDASFGGDEAGPRPTAGESAPSADGVVDGVVLVFAAASLTDAFTDLEASFEAANPAVDLQVNLAGSSSLREQILSGAPADVFASANESTMAGVVDAGLVRAGPTTFVTNQLAIAVPAGNPAGVDGLDDFEDGSLLIGLCAIQVPCGELGVQALEQAGVQPDVDTYEPDVRALLTKIGADELDAGIVYQTDVLGNRDVIGIEIPTESNLSAAYPIATLADGDNPAGGAAFVSYVLSADGQAVLAEHGFAPA